jgi:hypothetical protein
MKQVAIIGDQGKERRELISKEGSYAAHRNTPSGSAGRPQGTAPPLVREQSRTVSLLACAAAFSDAIGFLVLQQL